MFHIKELKQFTGNISMISALLPVLLDSLTTNSARVFPFLRVRTRTHTESSTRERAQAHTHTTQPYLCVCVRVCVRA